MGEYLTPASLRTIIEAKLADFADHSPSEAQKVAGALAAWGLKRDTGAGILLWEDLLTHLAYQARSTKTRESPADPDQGVIALVEKSFQANEVTTPTGETVLYQLGIV